MDGENNGFKPYEQMDDLGGKNHPYFWFNTHMMLVPKYHVLGSKFYSYQLSRPQGDAKRTLKLCPEVTAVH